MVDLDWKSTKMVSANKSPKITANTKSVQFSVPPPIRISDISSASSSSCSAYEQYIRLPELSKLQTCKDFPNWKNESILKPALQGLEISFRFISIILSDPRPYANHREWKRRLESLTTHQIELIAILCEDGEHDSESGGTAPIVDLSTSNGILARDGSIAEVWKLPGETHVVNKTSVASLLPRLATWKKSEDIASKIMFSIECEMRRCSYTLGLGEPNLSGKPNLNYDLICKPSELHSLKTSSFEHTKLNNYENQTLVTIHQILESWIQTSKGILKRIGDRIDDRDYDQASSDCWLLERVWKLLTDIVDLHVLVDPDDFLRLKNQLSIKASSESEAFCFRSKGLIDITKLSKNLKHKVPAILGVEVDPKGGPRIQEAVMRLYHNHKKSDYGKIHLLQALQAIESGLKRFFFSYRQLIMIVMGSLEARGNRCPNLDESADSLSQIFLEPTYFPSLDAAKTFLGDFWQYEHGVMKTTRS
ncbi:hypothetical protein MKX01_020351 [Papaver californicum]|nr:hypothetical protein MKX01_020351 [Papaver californicum]